MDHIAVFGQTCLYISIILFLVLAIADGICLKRIDFKVEKWLAIILGLYLFSALIRLIGHIIYAVVKDYETTVTYGDKFDLVGEFVEIIIFTLLYYFIFEIKDLRNMFESDTVTEYGVKFKSFRLFRAMALGWNATVSSMSLFLSIYIGATYDPTNENSSNLNALLYGQIILKGCQILVDLIMAWFFASLFAFLIKMKKAKNELLEESFNPRSKRVVWLTVVVFILNLNSSLCRLLHCTEIHHLIQESTMDGLKIMSIVMINIVVPITDVLTSLSILYLVVHIARSNLSVKLRHPTESTYEVLRILKKTDTMSSKKS